GVGRQARSAAHGPLRIRLITDVYPVEQPDDALAGERLPAKPAGQAKSSIGDLDVSRVDAVLAAAAAKVRPEILRVAAVEAARKVVALAAVAQQKVAIDEGRAKCVRGRRRTGRRRLILP